MSSVPLSKRPESRLDAQKLAYDIRNAILREIMNTFDYNDKHLRSIAQAKVKDIQNPKERLNEYRRVLSVLRNQNGWFMQNERDAVTELTRMITSDLRRATTIYPNEYAEYVERIILLDRVMYNCNVLQDELNYLVLSVPCDKNKYTRIAIDIETLFSKVHSLKESTKRKHGHKFANLGILSETDRLLCLPPTSRM